MKLKTAIILCVAMTLLLPGCARKDTFAEDQIITRSTAEPTTVETTAEIAVPENTEPVTTEGTNPLPTTEPTFATESENSIATSPSAPAVPSDTEPMVQSHQHSYTVTEHNATCTKPPYKLFSCACGHSYKEEDKLFSDATEENADADHKYDHVKFVLFNETDKYWVTAKLDEAEGVYYVTNHVTNEEDATVFTPVKSGNEFGKVIIRGTEDDEYKLFEIETADGYTLLKEPVSIILEAHETYDVCDIYSEDVLGVLQNDPRYGNLVNENIDLSNTPQEHLSHYLLSVDAYINGQQVSMVADEDSANAEALMTIVNTPGFDLPQTGDQGVWMYGVAGGTMMLAAVLVILFAFKKKEDQDTVQQ